MFMKFSHDPEYKLFVFILCQYNKLQTKSENEFPSEHTSSACVWAEVHADWFSLLAL